MKALFLSLLLLTSGLLLNAQEIDFDALDSYIKNSVEAFDQPGLAVGIVKDGELIWSKGYGKLDLVKAEMVNSNSVFFCASLSKAFTACAVGLLVDDGLVNWEDPVVQHMPWFQTPDPWVTQHMNVKDLLCHRSGWITFDGDLLWYGSNYNQKEILKRHSAEPTSYDFRDGYGYSNLMFIAAAQLIEEISGKSWDDFVTARILEPLGMNRSTVQTKDLEGMSNVAFPHVRKGQDPKAELKSMAYQSLEGADGATGINSSVVDLAKWDAMWANEGKVGDEQFLSLRSWITITTPANSFPVSPRGTATGKHYNGAALGWFTEDMRGVKLIKHSGGMPGFILNHTVVPEKDLAVIALGNGESYSVFAITNKILDLYLGDGNADPTSSMLVYTKSKHSKDSTRRADRVASRIKKTKPTLFLESYTGTFEDKIYGEAIVSLEKKTLSLSLLPAKELFSGELEHWHHDSWKWNHSDPFLEPGYVTFYFDADHKVKGFKIDQHSPDFHFYKLDFVKSTP